MSTDILINATSYETRIALVENDHLVELHIQRPSEKGLVGNIYKGRVVRVLPGMQAAFVNIGLDRTGFLYVDDVYISMTELEQRLLGQEQQPCGKYNFTSSVSDNEIRRISGMNIEDLLREGQDVTVQVGKDPIGTKGARLTCHITLPCRNLVFMPLTDHIGISRKIEDETLRQTLRERIEKLRPAGTGFIVRTVAEYADMEELEADMEFLLHLWDEIQDINSSSSAPSLVYEDLDITFRSVRDLFTADVNTLVVDDKETYENLLNFIKIFAPDLQHQIVFYQEIAPLFEAHGIEIEISRVIEKKVWLRSGGYIIIETTEALTVIDVNTGRFVGKNDLEETIFKTNMEAVKEIAYQLRLRNIGGIIIIDFIDMDDELHREELFTSFKEAVKKDKSRINILKLTEFGLVQMTRKRSCENLKQLLCEPCHYCAGEGTLKSRRTICYEIFRKISRETLRHKGNTLTLKVHPRIADMLLKEEEHVTLELERNTRKLLTIIPDNNLHIEKYEISWKN
ncbi:MAG: Rne/Rng family ribonuclease [Proteobacteria bacterium]|jgi:ribonuclease G|nr:Rne/Rng family ribonuclease [Desulfocapsa sp.]MBU3943934.1 Rne/Rng family ribonuclease [Pseudomonadota bacterium]MCG2742906.1 Rne/Rng family ribonuclease [Desulfobacteraceae bacterium]MDO8946503.1 Rne/Rng family ribonuclease [Desulfocapsaceae bacterium]MBU4027943.1 Rne/Rng family ribonuclease [Pseudomonadota bacterium]